uniref:Phenol acid carboxylase n=1 Tax=Peronospora matthiolae TaxID=2874970 RepID=A0AAV1U3K1_9STRA
MPMQVPGYHTNTSLHPSFDKDIRGLHLLYDYDAESADGKPEKWRYEMWFYSENRIVYSIHGGPMAGRLNYQTAAFQCIRPGELWQCNWLEETGTIVSLVYDILNQKITTMIGFSKGHWDHPEEAHGDKRNPEDFARWRKLAEIGNNRDRLILSEQANILETFRGAGNLVPIALDAETL